jgi:predicted DCC family thiol-disulfide oxidoreductase YuxK
MSAVYPLTLLYDATCAVCSLEMDHLRSRNAAGRLLFIDISAPGFDPAPFGATLDDMNAEIHARRADGQLIRGVQVLRLAYEAVGLGWVLRPTAWAPLRGLSEVGYRLFARHRISISRHAAPLINGIRRLRAHSMARRMRSCQAGACDLAARNTTHAD